MNNTKTYLAALLCGCTLAACTDKSSPQGVPASVPPTASSPVLPAAPAPAPAPAAASASAAATATDFVKHAELDCDDRKIVLDATCSDLYGPELLVCSRQSLTFLDSASGKEIGHRQFDASKHEGDTQEMVEEKIGTITCTRTAAGERYVVAKMFNGGSCEQCEWTDVYDWQGKLVGSNRDRSKPDKLVAELLSAAKNTGQLIGHNELEGFYSNTKP